MCGYCTEHVALEILAQLHSGVRPTADDPMQAAFLLQEAADLPALLDWVDDELTRTIAYCRVIQARCSTPDICRDWLSQTAIAALVDTESTRPRPLDARLFGRAPRLARLFAAELFSDDARWAALLDSSVFADQCEQLLRGYLSWWHGGVGLHKQVYGIMEDKVPGESELFEAVFPHIFFAVHFLAAKGEGRAVLTDLVRSAPDGTPAFVALDLWLQRRAAALLTAQYGPHAVLEGCGAGLRAALLAQCALQPDVDTATQSVLIEAIGQADEREWARGLI